MEKCTFCIQRIRRATRKARQEDVAVSEKARQDEDFERALNPACVNACPTETLVFGDLNDSESKVVREIEKHEGRAYKLLEGIGTGPSIVYLKKIDKEAGEVEEQHG